MKSRIGVPMLPAAVVVVSVILSLHTAQVSGATFTLNPTLDAFVTTGPTGNLINNNYGGAGALSFSAGGLEMGELQSVMQFNLSGAVNSFDATYGTGQWSIESISLRLTAASANNAIYNSTAAGLFGISWMQNDSWLEGTGSPASPGTTGITFGSLQSTFISPGDQNLGTFAVSSATSGNFTYSLGLSAGLIGDVTSGDQVSLRLFAADSTISAVFSSRNFGTIGNRPVLTLVAVPEPGTLALGAVGVALAGAAAWRRHSRRPLP